MKLLLMLAAVVLAGCGEAKYGRLSNERGKDASEVPSRIGIVDMSYDFDENGAYKYTMTGREMAQVLWDHIKKTRPGDDLTKRDNGKLEFRIESHPKGEVVLYYKLDEIPGVPTP